MFFRKIPENSTFQKLQPPLGHFGCVFRNSTVCEKKGNSFFGLTQRNTARSFCLSTQRRRQQQHEKGGKMKNKQTNQIHDNKTQINSK